MKFVVRLAGHIYKHVELFSFKNANAHLHVKQSVISSKKPVTSKICDDDRKQMKLGSTLLKPKRHSLPLSCTAGSRGLMHMRTNIVYFRVMRRLYHRE